MKKFFLLLLCLVMFGLVGCAQKGQPLLKNDSAFERWQNFKAKTSGSGVYDVLSGSLRFGPADDTKRVTYTLWSEAAEIQVGKESPRRNERIIRIEIGAGIGGSVGKMRIADGGLTLLLPKEGRIYVGSSSDSNLRRLLGLSLPFSVQSLNDFLAGRLFLALDEPLPERYETQEDGGIVYRCKTKDGTSELELDARSLPVRLDLRDGWKLEVAYDDSGLPSKISGGVETASGEQRLVMHVKERRPASSVSASSFGLTIPAGFTVYSLD